MGRHDVDVFRYRAAIGTSCRQLPQCGHSSAATQEIAYVARLSLPCLWRLPQPIGEYSVVELSLPERALSRVRYPYHCALSDRRSHQWTGVWPNRLVLRHWMAVAHL